MVVLKEKVLACTRLSDLHYSVTAIYKCYQKGFIFFTERVKLRRLKDQFLCNLTGKAAV